MNSDLFSMLIFVRLLGVYVVDLSVEAASPFRSFLLKREEGAGNCLQSKETIFGIFETRAL